jgi:hypothetical protein
MFFFIGGIQPKIIKLDDQLRMCSSCGLCEVHPLFPLLKTLIFLTLRDMSHIINRLKPETGKGVLR